MAVGWQLRIYENQRLVHSTDGTGAIELGRQAVGEPGPFAEVRDASVRRLVIARLDEDTVSRKHVRLDALADGRIRLGNLSTKLPIQLGGGAEVPPSGNVELPLPTVLTVGRRTIRIQPAEEAPPLLALPEATMPPQLGTPARRTVSRPSVLGMDVEQMCRWLQAAMGVLQGVAGSREFFPRAARAVVDLVGLDSGRVLLLDGNEWRVQAAEYADGPPSNPDWRPSRQVLARLVGEKRTCWIGAQEASHGQSLIGMDAVVAAPILNAVGDVIGALYGDRRQARGLSQAGSITKLEAMLVELLAGGVAAGLACIEQEQLIVRARVQFEQFFTPELARQLEAEPDLLRGRDLDITVLFCDVRGFSRFSEKLGPAGTVEWLADVMGTLSECVLAHRGVLVDYIGDELMAMWGAPVEQPDQARLAASAALDMLAQLPKLNERWAPILGGSMGFGVGLNTGPARVGNTGTQRKFKYGPLGNSVNLSSRVQGATKYLKAPLLVTKATHSRLDGSMLGRRVCSVRVVNIAEPVALYELVPPGRPGWPALAAAYEDALKRFEKRDLDGAMRGLFQLLSSNPDDGPALVLLSRVIALRDADPTEFDPVWELPGK
ncbi:MAG TPA: adenylate/guanylate cyclase domain-containing protein [Gemmataceae bacterium]|jgi:adenylate cyclase|nr:adenylate/guanylate cyclase domain-containing protein [Gemmataceae bacterium]